MVVPLTDKFNRNMLPLPGNGLTPVPNQWFSAADSPYIPIHNNPQRYGQVSPKATPSVQQREIDMAAFFKGGNLDGQY
ncbi:hypothetical protein D3C75_1326160 [compost metagenome]